MYLKENLEENMAKCGTFVTKSDKMRQNVAQCCDCGKMWQIVTKYGKMRQMWNNCDKM